MSFLHTHGKDMTQEELAELRRLAEAATPGRCEAAGHVYNHGRCFEKEVLNSHP